MATEAMDACPVPRPATCRSTPEQGLVSPDWRLVNVDPFAELLTEESCELAPSEPCSESSPRRAFLRLKLLHAPERGAAPDGAMTDGVVEHVVFAPADLRDLRCLVSRWLQRACSGKPEYEMRFFTDRRCSELTDEEYKNAVSSGSLIVEVVLRGEMRDPKNLRLCYWDSTPDPTSPGDCCLSVSGLSDGLAGSEAAASSPSGTDDRRTWSDDVLSEHGRALSEFGRAVGERLAAAGAKWCRSLFSLRPRLFSQSPLLLTATTMLGSDFSQALLALSMPPLNKAKAAGSPEFYYRFFVAPDGNPFRPQPFAKHLVFRTRFGRPLPRWAMPEPSIERPLSVDQPSD